MLRVCDLGSITRCSNYDGYDTQDMVQLLNRPWRNDLAALASTADRSVLIVAPYIKHAEATWFCQLLRPGVEVTTLANIDAEAVSTSALDLAALRCLAEASPSAKLIALSNLHAKVFVADEKVAIVTSGNLTRAALDRNLEYGVLLNETKLVRAVRSDMLSFTRLGSQVDTSTITALTPLETELRQARANITSSATPAAKRRFTEVMRQARPVLASIQVGNRSAHAVFGEAIQFILARGPQTTKAIQEEVRLLMPALCDEHEYFMIKGERYGKAWKRRLRHAQLHLKRKGVVTYNRSEKTWALIRS